MLRWFHVEPTDVSLPFIFTVTVGSGQSFQLPTVLPGTYDAIIDWGDTNSNALTVWNVDRSHTYTTGGTYEIKISGEFRGWSVNNYADRLKITEVKQWGILQFQPTGNPNAFWGCNNALFTATDVPDLEIISNGNLFFGACASLINIPNASSWDVSNIGIFNQMFFNCPNFQGVGLEDWDMSMANSINIMFVFCTLFNRNINSWNTSNITGMDGTFRGCTNFNQPLDNWDVSKVTVFGGGGNQGFLNNCVNFNQNLNSWQFSTISNVSTRFMFQGCSSYNQPMDNWNTSRFVNCQSMFNGCSALDQDFSSWDVANVTNMNAMFNGVTLSTANYDALLISWAAQSVQSGVIFSGGNSKYTNSGASLDARNTLISTYGWTITDGGPA